MKFVAVIMYLIFLSWVQNNQTNCRNNYVKTITSRDNKFEDQDSLSASIISSLPARNIGYKSYGARTNSKHLRNISMDFLSGLMTLHN